MKGITLEEIALHTPLKVTPSKPSTTAILNAQRASITSATSGNMPAAAGADETSRVQFDRSERSVSF
jgi:hypothetical protein